MSQKLTSLGVVFDASQVIPAAPMEAVPAGWYSVAITDGEVTVNDGGQGRRIALEFTVLEGQYKGRKIFDGLNIVHSNPQAQQIAAGHLSAICHAVGVFQVQDVQQLFNKPFQIKVDVEGERTVDLDGNATELPKGSPNTKTYEAKNRFKGAKAGSAPVVATNGAPGAAAPAWAASPAPAAAPAAGSGATPPWGATAAPPVASPAPAAAPAAVKPGKPKKATAKPAAAAAKVERKFFVGLEGPTYENAVPESQIVEWLSKGMPADTGLCLEGAEEYKTAAEHGVGAAPAPVPAAVAPVAAAPAAAAPAPAASGAPVPPWAR